MKLTMAVPALFFTLLAGVIIPNCDIKSPTEGVEVLFNEDPLTIVAIEVVDAKTGLQIEPVSPDSVSIRIEGQQKHLVTDLTEKSATSFTGARGFFNFAIDDEYDVSADFPVILTIRASSPGYITSTKSITVTSTKGESYTIPLVKREAPPEGVKSATAPEGNSDPEGALQETIEVVSEPTDTPGPKVRIVVEKGTTIRDENGEALTGKLKTEITHFDTKTETSLNSIPGGLFTTMTDNTGKTEEALFIPAAFVEIEITDEYGTSASTFDKPVSVTFSILGDTYNPETKRTIADGDIVPIWRYDEKTAIWEYQAEGTAHGPTVDGEFEVPFEITHLSYWSGGWKDTSGNECNEGASVLVTGGFATVDVKFLRQSDGSYLTSLGKSVNPTDPKIRLASVPGGVPVTVEAWYGLDRVGSVDVPDLCGRSIELPVVIPGKTVTFSVEVYDINDPDRRMRPNRGIYIDEIGYRKYIGFMNDGIITVFGLTMGREYTFWVFHEGVWYSGTHTVDERSHAELEYGVEP